MSRDFLITLIFLIHLFFSIYFYEPYTFLHGDGIAFAFISISISEDFDLYIENNFPFFAIGDRPEKSFFSIGRNGKIFPKHSPLISFFAAPFYKIFGFNGFLIFNLTVFFGGLFFISRVFERKVSILKALSFSSIFLLPFVFYHTYSFSPDIFLFFLISSGLFFLNFKKDFFCGVITGIAVFVRPNYIFQIFPFLFLTDKKLKYLVGTVIGVLPFLLYNTVAFGMPWKTGYDKTLVMTKKGVEAVSHYELFSVDFSRFYEIIFLKDRGLIYSAPIIFPLLLLTIFRFRENKKFSLFLILTWVWHYIFYSFYLAWMANHFGLRFFLVPVLLTSISSVFF